jgi:hypothetical protein
MIKYAMCNYVEGKVITYVLLKYGFSEKTILIITMVL